MTPHRPLLKALTTLLDTAPFAVAAAGIGLTALAAGVLTALC